MENEHWAEIRGLLSESSNTPELVIDYMAVINILQMCVRGLANLKIARFNGMDEEMVRRTIFQFLGFNGWKFDLDLDPWRMFVVTNGNFESYKLQILSLTNLLNCDIIQLSYKLCKKYEQIREEIKQYD
jgi:hypothetical protein